MVDIQKPPLVIKNIHLGFTSKVNCCTSDCAICLNSLEIGCIECISQGKNNCISIKGQCNHGFHEHCITSWLKKCNKCPIDKNDWNTVKNF